MSQISKKEAKELGIEPVEILRMIRQEIHRPIVGFKDKKRYQRTRGKMRERQAVAGAEGR